MTARAVDLPDMVEVDVSVLEELHSAIHVSDLPPSPKYKVLDPPEEVLAVVNPPKVEVEEVAEAVEAAEAEAEGAEAEGEGAAEGEARESAEDNST